uniref:Gp134 n=1 Tax=Caviid herpesvirus 2 str. CIDMTR TaxID=1415526 RepID=U6HA08_9BETA|nr:gp134 [Caviid herpesvirus 2 str. CIDMTR]
MNTGTIDWSIRDFIISIAITLSRNRLLFVIGNTLDINVKCVMAATVSSTGSMNSTVIESKDLLQAILTSHQYAKPLVISVAAFLFFLLILVLSLIVAMRCGPRQKVVIRMPLEDVELEYIVASKEPYNPRDRIMSHRQMMEENITAVVHDKSEYVDMSGLLAARGQRPSVAVSNWSEIDTTDTSDKTLITDDETPYINYMGNGPRRAPFPTRRPNAVVYENVWTDEP